MTTASFPFGNPPTCNLPGLHFVVGRMVLHSTTPTIASGKGFTVSKAATGRYRITLNRTAKIICAVGFFAKATGSDFQLRKTVWDEAVEGANIVEFATEDGTGSLEDAQDTDQVEFIIVCMSPVTSHPD